MPDAHPAERTSGPRPSIAKGFMEETFRFEESYWWFAGLKGFIRKGISLLEGNGLSPEGEKGTLLLDAACGTGANIVLLQDYGRAVGVDILEESIAGCRLRGLDRLARGSITNLPFPEESFDLILSCDALQCLGGDLDERALGEFHRVLKSGGGLILNVAAHPFLHGSHSVASGEVRRFVKGELESKLRRAGQQIVLVSYVYFFTFPFLLLWRGLAGLLRAGKPAPSRSDFFRLPAPLNSLLLALARIEARLLARFPIPFGSSLFSVSRKAP